MKEIAWLLGAYLLGNILTGYVLAKFFYHKNIHNEGSGNVGARNAGRIFGKKAFVITFFGDAAKGAIIVLITKWLGFSVDLQILALLAVVLGHIYPILFHFKGGKGMSTFIGGLLAFHPLLFSAFAAVFILFYIILKSLTLAGMVAVALLPAIMYFFQFNIYPIFYIILLSATVILAHRQNIRDKIFSERKIS
ncbi:glycerol-3-phosphate acyltransferase [Lederbergia wuyishanensis]|uniref:Glycerol-3-phosphate acyltransferase n=1 Tax=Lederbergia wuyishanensis TaxID=1347903 RepID=A0ABU0D7Q3_9BACI|nr:glycerol-3-phosphate acyltransferase [Lederbergia wuyishanensis]MCJ8009062.1 glycerol-3-phosphate acyltransferase [Lederbergia wuyishanensis]MDQ0344398.1 glycerol-3-phosphate acyltransferase PlsY [Lederbergia wuyishanensis]